MTAAEAVIGVAVGVVAGVASGLLGVGGGIVMTPGIQVLMGAPPIVALATPLPAILPTAATGAWTYRRAGELDPRAAWSMVVPGIVGAVAGAALTDVLNTHILLVATAVILAYQAVAILRGAERREGSLREVHVSAYAATGFTAGFVSGLLGIGGGLIMVPVLVGGLGMPLKRALGTSLAAIVALVVPGTIVHASLGHIDWAIFAIVTVGSVPGARVGARIALRAKTKVLAIVVGSFLLAVAIAYGVSEAVAVVRA